MQERKKFKIQLDRNWFEPDDILTDTNGVKVKVTRKPKTKYNKWYHKLIRWITFGYCFQKEYSYTVKLLDDERTTNIFKDS